MQTNLCKLSADFAQPIGGCLKALKEGMPQTDPDVALRVAEWLALHINNHDFIWSWHRWESVLELAPYDPTRYTGGYRACNKTQTILKLDTLCMSDFTHMWLSTHLHYARYGVNQEDVSLLIWQELLKQIATTYALAVLLSSLMPAASG